MKIRLIALVALGIVPRNGSAEAPGVWLGDLAWPEAEVRLREAPVVVLPFGPAAKEHGPHLPLNADAKVMEYLCEQAIRSRPVVIAPPILHGWFPAFPRVPRHRGGRPRRVHALRRRGGAAPSSARAPVVSSSSTRASAGPAACPWRWWRAISGKRPAPRPWSSPGTTSRRRSCTHSPSRCVGGTRTRSRPRYTSSCSPLSSTWKRRSRTCRPLRRTTRATSRGSSRAIPAIRPTAGRAFRGTRRRRRPRRGAKALAILTAQWLKALSGFAEAPRRR